MSKRYDLAIVAHEDFPWDKCPQTKKMFRDSPTTVMDWRGGAVLSVRIGVSFYPHYPHCCDEDAELIRELREVAEAENVDGIDLFNFVALDHDCPSLDDLDTGSWLVSPWRLGRSGDSIRFDLHGTDPVTSGYWVSLADARGRVLGVTVYRGCTDVKTSLETLGARRTKKLREVFLTVLYGGSEIFQLPGGMTATVGPVEPDIRRVARAARGRKNR